MVHKPLLMAGAALGQKLEQWVPTCRLRQVAVHNGQIELRKVTAIQISHQIGCGQ